MLDGLFRLYGVNSIIQSALNSARALLLSQMQEVRIGSENGVLWPLFLLSQENKFEQYEVDTCATALGFSATRELLDEEKADATELTQRALLTLLALRKEDGSWPSIQLSPGLGAPAAMEGIVNDTIYALSALLDAGFLEPDHSSARPHLPEQFRFLQTLAARIGWLEKTITWISNNRLDRAWFYTSVEFMADRCQFEPTVGPTSAMILVLRRISAFLENQESCSYCGLLNSMRIGATTWLSEIQHVSGGFGRNSKDVPRVVHTAQAILALLSDDQPHSGTAALRACDWLLNNSTRRKLSRLGEADAFDEYGQAILNEHHLYRKRLIAHEYPAEPILLLSYCALLEREKNSRLLPYRRTKISKKIFAFVRLVIDRQQQSGAWKGSFRSRRSLSVEHYPVYWVYHSVTSLRKAKALISTGAISYSKNLINGIVFRIGLLVMACVAYVVVQGWDIKGLLLLFVSGIAVNVASLGVTRD